MKRNYTIDEENIGKRLDHFLVANNPKRTRTYIQKLIHEQLVTVDKKFFKASHLLELGEEIEVNFPVEHAFPKAETSNLGVLYEDADLLILNKPPGLTIHPNDSSGKGTLVNALLDYNPSINQAVFDKNSALSRSRAGIVHRLDKDTSGVMVIAKTADALNDLAGQFKEHSTEKHYLVLVYGKITEEQEIGRPIQRKAGRGLMSASYNADKGRSAHTIIKPLKTFTLPHGVGEISLIECEITTGRTHQIRVHTKFIGHPVVGDQLYTNKTAIKLNRKFAITRQMLHAASLSFTHPTTKERVSFSATPPEDMQKLISYLESLPSDHFDKKAAS